MRRVILLACTCLVVLFSVSQKKNQPNPAPSSNEEELYSKLNTIPMGLTIVV